MAGQKAWDGASGEAKVIDAAIERKIKVFSALNGCLDDGIDMVFDLGDNKLVGIQVKNMKATHEGKKGSLAYQLNLGTTGYTGRRYTKKDCSFIIGVVKHRGQVHFYIVPVELAKYRKCITINLNPKYELPPACHCHNNWRNLYKTWDDEKIQKLLQDYP